MTLLGCITVLLSFLHLVYARAYTHGASFTPDYVLEATHQSIEIGCATRGSVVINGTSPGPTIYLREGQTTWIRVFNRIPGDNFTIHWHGLTQRTAPFSDGTPLVSQWPIPTDHFFDYEIHPEIGDAGSYFYHSHVGFQQSTAYGSLIVQDADGLPYDYDDDITLIFGDFYAKTDEVIVDGLLADPFRWSGEPNNIVVNGYSGSVSFDKPRDSSCTPHVIDVEPDKLYRIRAIGATAISFVKMAFEDHSELEVIEADGQYTKAAAIDHIQVSPGQRFSYLLRTKTVEELRHTNKTTFWARYESRDRPTSVTGYALLRYGVRGNPGLLPPLPPASPVAVPNDTRNYLEYTLESLSQDTTAAFPRLSEVTRTVTIRMNQILKTGSLVNGSLNGVVEWAQNNVSWKENVEDDTRTPYLINVLTTGQSPNYTLALANNGHDPTTNTYPARVGEVLDIVWLSNSGPTGGFDFHPMHIHGEHAWDLGSGNGTYDAVENEKRFANFTPAKRDTTVLYRYAVRGPRPFTTMGWRAWRIRVTEQNVGAWMMHCHVAQHAVMGMNTVWVFGDAEEILTRFPRAPFVQGYLEFGGSAYGNGDRDPVVNHYFDGEDGVM
ncbi:Iron transport multicopper oxidase [Sphaceloma murrayae]|uniref:Iron transport multicopper oxidase n=1 Tax=Sphaceloma murrayae TaxID=2082308 RepID=A0A2K1QSZ3_9PEZI|nr:Iron transport multicopper oxidase [Sphaceloma murrayae]